VCLNSWSNVDGGWSHANARALIDGYENVRPLSTGETQALPTLLRGAALRFLLTRLADFVNQVEGALVEVKDPLEYADLLAFHSGEGAASFSGSSDA
jgi:homoserine kinase type II